MANNADLFNEVNFELSLLRPDIIHSVKVKI